MKRAETILVGLILFLMMIGPGASTAQPIFATFWDGGLYKSIDGGRTWERFLEQSQITSIFSTDDITYVGVFNSGALRSKDGGVTWENLNLYSVNQFFQYDSALFAATFWGLHKSLDGGESWALLNNRFPLPDPLTTNFEVGRILSTRGTIFVQTNLYGIFRSLDGGETWEACNDGIPPDQDNRYPFLSDLSFSLNGNLFLSYWGRVYRSEDRGNSWVIAKNNGLETSFFQLLVVGNTLFAGSSCVGTIYKSLDGGDNWVPSGNGIDQLISSLIYSGGKLYASGLRGYTGQGKSLIYESADGLNWNVVYNGFEEKPYLKLFATWVSVKWFDDTTEFVKQQYRDFLNREADEGGLQFWVGVIDSGAMTRAQVIESFFWSEEFGQRIAPIARLYFAYFLRIPDYGGLMFWINAYTSGMSLGAISDAFAGSEEFVQTYGALSNEGFVNLIYQNILGRAPDPGGYTFWVGELNSGRWTRGQVIVGFSESPEYRGLTFNEGFVTMMYVGMLRRAPEQEGFDWWVDYLDNGNSGLALIDGFLNSQEYASRFQ